MVFISIVATLICVLNENLHIWIEDGRHAEKEAQNYLQVNILLIELAFGVIPIKRDIPQCRQITHKHIICMNPYLILTTDDANFRFEKSYNHIRMQFLKLQMPRWRTPGTPWPSSSLSGLAKPSPRVQRGVLRQQRLLQRQHDRRYRARGRDTSRW